MSELEIVNLYEKSDNKKNDNFVDNINSNLHITTNYNSNDSNFEWLDIMEETVPYLDNILRTPNRFIVNEEELVKIELARRVTVESIKHLSKNTNLIQDYNQKTGDVRPSKILNINKEESFDTYENRFIYSLIKNMRFYIDRKKKNLFPIANGLKDDKKMEYNAVSRLGKEKIDISLTVNSKIDDKVKEEIPVNERIEKLLVRISDLTASSVYHTIDKLHISLVTSPIKKTNVILKNVNFQYAVKLWNYMQEHVDEDSKVVKEHKDFYDDSNLKKCIDESFLLNYLVLDSVSNKDSKHDKNELSEKIVENMIEKVINLDSNIDEAKLKEMIDKKYSVIKYKTVVNEKQIEDKFKKYIDKYLDDVNLLEL